jgi:hypothetical protein
VSKGQAKEQLLYNLQAQLKGRLLQQAVLGQLRRASMGLLKLKLGRLL